MRLAQLTTSFFLRYVVEGVESGNRKIRVVCKSISI